MLSYCLKCRQSDPRMVKTNNKIIKLILDIKLVLIIDLMLLAKRSVYDSKISRFIKKL